MKRVSINIFLFTSMALGFTACLKKADMNFDPDNAKSTIEFANTGNNLANASSLYPRFATDLGSMNEGDTVQFDVNVSYSGAGTAPEDITVTLGIDTNALKLFNTQNGTDYEVPAASIYSIPASTVIKKGTKYTPVKMVVTRTSSFDFDINYGVPLTIASASTGTISGNFGKAIYSFTARNQYDGVYEMTATAPMIDGANGALTGDYPREVELITYAGNSVALFDEHIGSGTYGHAILNGTTASYYGDFSPVFVFDAAGTVTGCGNYYGQGAGANRRGCALIPSADNKITWNTDGTVKSIDVHYAMTQSGATRTSFHERFIYSGERH
jgi:hypothetical protein